MNRQALIFLLAIAAAAAGLSYALQEAKHAKAASTDKDPTLSEVSTQAEARYFEAEVADAQIQARIVRLGEMPPGGLAAVEQSIAALTKARAEIAAIVTPRLEELAKDDEDILTLERAQDQLAHPAVSEHRDGEKLRRGRRVHRRRTVHRQHP